MNECLVLWVAGLFHAFDENRDNHIDFKEISCGLSACCRGPRAERQKCKLTSLQFYTSSAFFCLCNKAHGGTQLHSLLIVPSRVLVLIHVLICLIRPPPKSPHPSLLQSVWCGSRWGTVSRGDPGDGGCAVGGVERQQDRLYPCKTTTLLWLHTTTNVLGPSHV